MNKLPPRGEGERAGRGGGGEGNRGRGDEKGVETEALLLRQSKSLPSVQGQDLINLYLGTKVFKVWGIMGQKRLWSDLLP